MVVHPKRNTLHGITMALFLERGTSVGPHTPEVTKYLAGVRGAYESGLTVSGGRDLESSPHWTWSTSDAYFLEGIHNDPTEEWAVKQRKRIDKWLMPDDQLEAIRRLKGWTWHDPESRWGHSYEIFLKWLDEFEGAEVNSNWREYTTHWVGVGAEFDLYKWAGRQRDRYRRGMIWRTQLFALESIPNWSWNRRSPQSGKTRRSFRERELMFRLRHLIQEEGVLDSAVGTDEGYRADMIIPSAKIAIEYDGYWWHSDHDYDIKRDEAFRALGWTVIRVREEPLRLLGNFDLSTTIIEDIDELAQRVTKALIAAGCTSKIDPRTFPDFRPSRNVWDDRLARFLKHVDANGGNASCVTTQTIMEDGTHLGNWVVVQRRYYKQGRMDTSRIRQLELIPGWSWVVMTRYLTGWKANISALKRYVELFSALPGTHDRDDLNRPVGQWMYLQRFKYVNGELDPNQMAELDSLPGWNA